MYTDYQDDYLTITVDELRKKLKNIQGDTKVYIILDKSEDNWDYDNDQWKEVHPIESVQKEWLRSEDGDECNCILHLQDPFYENFSVKRINK